MKVQYSETFRCNKVEICHASLIWINHWLVSYPVLNIELAGHVGLKCQHCLQEKNKALFVE